MIAKTGSVDWQGEFARYLSLRIIGVYDIFSMNASDLLFSLVKLIEAHDESFECSHFSNNHQEFRTPNTIGRDEKE